MLEKTKNKGSLILIISVHLLLSVLGLKQGFINIDCGKTFSYDDPKTGLHFVPDSEYIDSGENRQVISNLRDKADYPQANDLRSFPNGTRNCYTLRPVVKGNKYLLRAFFMYGNYDGKDSLPKFDLYFGANLWFHVKIINSSVNFYTEIIAVAPANSISVCLKNTNDGIPFISTLELRPLSHFLYKEVDTFNSLILQTPRDCGEAKRTSKIRYPDDSYDRLWVPYDPYIWSHIETNNEIITNTNGGYQVPSEIMKTAAIPKDGGTKIDFNWTASFKWTEYGVGPAEYYIFLHFAELLPSSGNNSRIFDVKFNDEIIGSNVTPEYMGKSAGRASVLSWRKRLQIVVDAAQGLEYLHKGCKPAIIHRDVKTSNILLNKNMEARISDFGLSKIIQNDNITHVTTMVMGTPGYLDPEYYITNQLNEKSDVYSFGVVLLEVITGKPAIVKIQEPTHIIECVQAGIEQGDLNMIVDPKFEEAYDANSVWKAIKIALSCTSNRSLHRITMTQVVTLLKECLDLETDIDDDINLESRTTTTSYATSTGDSNANSTVSMVH